MMSSPIVIVPSLSPVALSVIADIRTEEELVPMTFTDIASSVFLRSAVGTRSTVLLCTAGSKLDASFSHTPLTRGVICTSPSRHGSLSILG